MLEFELYLLSQGFKPHHISFLSGKMEEVDGYMELSSIMNIDNRWVKDGLKITIGLHEKGKPPTIIHPRPKEVQTNIVDKLTPDDIMNRMLKQYSPEEILQKIKENAK